MSVATLGEIAHPTELFSDRDSLGKAFGELNAGWPVLVMVEGHPNLLLPYDAVGHHASRRLLDLPLFPALVLPANTPIRSAFESIGEDDFFVVKAEGQFGVIARVTILEALLKELDLPGAPDTRVDAPLPDIVDELPEGIVVLDEAQRISFYNRSGRRLLGLLSSAKKGDRLEALAEVPLAVLVEDAKQGLPTDLYLGKPTVRIFSVRIMRPLSDQTLRMVLVLRDITHVRHRQLRDATRERMALLGRLASGIAHDFNNMLTVIMAQASLIHMKSDQDETIRKGAEAIHAAALKSSNLVRQLLVFGRRELAHSIALNLQGVLRELESILQNLVGERVILELRLPEDLWPVAADPAQIERIIANLIVNARNAMPNGGRIIIEGSNEVNSSCIPFENDNPLSRVVRISVCDTGRGMNADTLGRVFEPFFTTHDEDGTGLGLATVRSEVKQLGGSVTIQSELGVGTTVEIFLPVSEKPAQISHSDVVHRLAPATGGHILVILDQEDLRHVIQQILEHAGYVVQATGSFTEALEKIIADGEPDLLILEPARKEADLTALEEAGKQCPNLRTLLLDQEANDVQFPQSGFALVEYLPKPFSGVELLERVAMLIGEGAEESGL